VNLPFRFAAAAASSIVVLTDEAANLVLAGLLGSGLSDDNLRRFALLGQPIFPGWLVGLSVSADKTCTITFGCYDTTATTFYPVYPVQLVAGGSSEHVARFENPGFPMPLGGAVQPAIKVEVAAADVILTGQIELIPNFAERDTTPFNPGGFGLGTLGTTKP